MTFLRSASEMHLSIESTSLLLKVSQLVARYTHTLYLNVLLITASEVQAGGYLLKRALRGASGV